VQTTSHIATRDLVAHTRRAEVLANEQSLAELSDIELMRLLGESQPSFTSPEAGYTK